MVMSEFMNGSEHENNNEQQSDGITPLNLTNGNDGMPQGMNAADAVQPEKENEDNAQNVQTAAFDGSGMENGVSNFRMQQAISAYEMFMTA